MSDPEAELQRIREGLRRWDQDDLEAGLGKFQRRREAYTRLDGTLERVRAALRRWAPEDVEVGLSELRFRVGEDRRRQHRRGVFAVGVSAAAVIALATWNFGFRSPTLVVGQHAPGAAASGASSAGVNAASDDRRITLEDGSEVTLVGRESQASVLESGAHRVTVAVSAGRAAFRVEHRPERVFVVQVGNVKIEDLGTVFDVVRRPHEVSVHVVEGAVRVSAGDRVDNLQAGGRGTYPLSEGPAAAAASVEPDTDAGKAPPARSAEVSSQDAWRSAARAGRYGPAFQLLQAEGFATVRDEPNDLLLAADVARLSGHPADAIGPLRNLLRSHRSDPRSPAAAFTLGSVLLRDLSRPRDAALAFLEVQRLAPGGNLAEDAEARATEAWYRAGERERAEASLTRYRARYPAGRHLAFLNRLIQTAR